MICSVYTLGIYGIRGSKVTVESYISNGLPNFDIVGLPDAAVKEARERVRAAAKTSAMHFPTGRITVNMAPANMKKGGTHYDLPILLSIMCACGAIRRPRPGTAFIGELALDGTIRGVNGVLPMAIAAKREGFDTLFVPAENAAEATLARGPAVIGVHSVAELAAALNGETVLQEEPIWMPERQESHMLDFKDVVGQENVKRAKVIEITKTTEPSCVIIEDNKMRFTKAAAIELGYPAFIRVLLDDAGQRIAIQVAKGNESNVVKFSADKENQKNSIIYQNTVMVDLIRGVMPSWQKGVKYCAKGTLSKEDKAIVFDLKTAEVYERFKRKVTE